MVRYGCFPLPCSSSGFKYVWQRVGLGSWGLSKQVASPTGTLGVVLCRGTQRQDRPLRSPLRKNRHPGKEGKTSSTGTWPSQQCSVRPRARLVQENLIQKSLVIHPQNDELSVQNPLLSQRCLIVFLHELASGCQKKPSKGQIGLAKLLSLTSDSADSRPKDCIFFVDMLLQFLTSYPKTTPRGQVWEAVLGSGLGLHGVQWPPATRRQAHGI